MDVDMNAGNHGVSPQDYAFIAAATPRIAAGPGSQVPTR
jgi:hypothetical protein